MSIVVRALVAALGATALVQFPLSGWAGASPQRADAAAPSVVEWEALVVRDRLKLFPSKAAVDAVIRDATAVAAVQIRFVRGGLVHGGKAVNTHGTTWRAEFPVPAADSTGVYEVWIDARDTIGNAADTKVGTMRLP